MLHGMLILKTATLLIQLNMHIQMIPENHGIEQVPTSRHPQGTIAGSQILQ